MIPGLGQLYNRQAVKGLLLFTLVIAFFIVFQDLLRYGFWGLFTLGTDVQYDHSIFLLAEGILTVMITLLLIGIYAWNLYDAYKVGVKRDNQKKVNGLREQYHNLIDIGFPYLMMSPGFLLMLFVVMFPILFVILLAFTNYDLYHSPPANLVEWVGVQNFIDIFNIPIWRDTLFSVLAWTVVWTLAATTFQTALGIILAVIMNQQEIRFKKIIRTIFILPWAVPAFVSILVFAGMFNESFGAINRDILGFFGIAGVPWMTDAMFTRVALIFIQTWLGFPFIFAMTTGVLQSIPNELYEAAEVDGASIFQKFKSITLPLILFATAPILITQYTFNFNNFNVIFLFNGGGPAMTGQSAGGTDILISWIYSLTMNSAQYGKAAAITMILSFIVISIALWQFRRTKSFQEEDMM
ncbi:sugar ABC transporter permease [Oceanobacillus piezotolerans]|uniref:Sugar ABC transporter permease n=1 Tax=Oceanobacillus piezotolerans TaxID=2448030 RepID=A0A498DDU0_9BACI|nr:sugar ABC transporter permease [Oceanobacillus piezotolerans]